MFVHFFEFSFACIKNSECFAVSQNSKYVACSNSQCKCRFWNGFTGDAKYDSKCTCPWQVVNWNNDVFCINLTQALSSNKQLVYQEKNKNAIKSLYNDILNTNLQASLAKLSKKTYPSYWAQNCQGRSIPLDVSFYGVKGAAEYFYGTVHVSGMNISQFNIVEIVAEGNKVYYRVDWLFTSSAFPKPTNYTQLGRLKFNSNSQIESMDLNNMQLGLLFDGTANHTLRVQIICGIALRYCQKTNAQYSSYAQCAQFLESIPEGTWERANSNSVICREYHSLLVIMDPAVYCPHIGISGGGKCIDFPYENYYKHRF
jgi:hypothetical protein